jgi:prepilin-type N-terminal cleavage/methylation domain-containing protein
MKTEARGRSDLLALPCEGTPPGWRQRAVPAGNGRPAPRGFTLLETLVALCALGLIMSAVYGSYRAVTSSIAGLQRRIALEQEGRFFVQRLSRQIRCCYGGRMDQGKRASLTQKGTKPIASPEEETRLFRGGSRTFDDALLQFVTTSSGISRKSSPGCLAIVAYKVDTWQHTLLACEEIYGRRGRDDDKDWRVILEGLQEIEFRYFNGVGWQTEWDSTLAGGLPRAVRIRLVLEPDQDNVPRCFTAVAPIRCGTPRKLDVGAERPPGVEEGRAR